MPTFTLLHSGTRARVRARVDGDSFRIPAQDLEEALGCELTPEGLCVGAVCYPTTAHPGLVNAEGVEITRFAGLLGFALNIDLRLQTLTLDPGTSAAPELLAELPGGGPISPRLPAAGRQPTAED